MIPHTKERMDGRQSKQIVDAIPLRDQVADIVRRMILTGELSADESISERSISQRLAVSTTPVKEAFRALEAEGLIYVKPRRGSYVSRLSADFMLQLVFMRGSLEGVAAFFATTNATQDEIDQMAEALDGSGKLIQAAGDPIDISKCNNRFHRALRNASRNDYLIGLITSMRSIDKTFREMSLMAADDEPARAHKEHMGILDALKQGDPEETECRMVAHVRRVAVFVIERNHNIKQHAETMR